MGKDKQSVDICDECFDKLYAEKNWNEIDRSNLFEISDNLEKIAKALESLEGLIRIKSEKDKRQGNLTSGK